MQTLFIITFVILGASEVCLIALLIKKLIGNNKKKSKATSK